MVLGCSATHDETLVWIVVEIFASVLLLMRASLLRRLYCKRRRKKTNRYIKHYPVSLAAFTNG